MVTLELKSQQEECHLQYEKLDLQNQPMFKNIIPLQRVSCRMAEEYTSLNPIELFVGGRSPMLFCMQYR